MSYLDSLNSEQRLFAETIDGPLLANAAAGSGKTFSAICRVANIIESGVDSNSILMITFTNKAAQEMRDRAVSFIGEKAKDITACTFHSFCAEILRKYGARISIPPGFDIITPSNCVLVLNYVREILEFPKEKGVPTSNALANIFSLSINRNQTIEKTVLISYPEFEPYMSLITKAKQGYEEYKNSRNILDFDDLLIHTKDMLSRDTELCRLLSDKYKYIIVDEFQDTNLLQLDILRLLRQFDNKNLCVIGDFHQSIYLWRGAEPQCINNFAEEFENCKIVNLDTNYRSSQEILDLANGVINKSKHHWKRNMTGLFHNIKPNYIITENNFSQSEYVIDEIKKLTASGTPLRDIAVLSRTASGLNEIEVELLRLPKEEKMAYRKFGGIKFLEKEISQDLLSFLQILAESEVEIYWMRYLQLFEGVGSVSSQLIADKIIENGIPNAISTLDSFKGDKSIRKACQNAILEFKSIFVKARSQDSISDKIKVSIDLYKKVKSDFYYRKSKDYAKDMAKLEEDLEQLSLLIDISKDYSSLRTLLDDLALEGINPESSQDGYLTLSTIHSAKGLEWENVFLVYACDEHFPGERGIKSSLPEAYALHEEEIEESRRLLYVAITRAKKRLDLIFPKVISRYTSMSYCSKSRFFAKIDLEKLCNVKRYTSHF